MEKESLGNIIKRCKAYTNWEMKNLLKLKFIDENEIREEVAEIIINLNKIEEKIKY